MTSATTPRSTPRSAAATERWGRIDVLVNNAGIDDDTPFLDINREKWRTVVDTNLTGAFLMAQRRRPQHGGGRRRRDCPHRVDRRLRR